MARGDRRGAFDDDNDLESFSHKDLQERCVLAGIKANKTKEDMIKAIRAIR